MLPRRGDERVALVMMISPRSPSTSWAFWIRPPSC
jgi:hypothetical protein